MYVTKPQASGLFSSRKRVIFITGTSSCIKDPRDCESFPLEEGFRSIRFPFNTRFPKLEFKC